MPTPVMRDLTASARASAAVVGRGSGCACSIHTRGCTFGSLPVRPGREIEDDRALSGVDFMTIVSWIMPRCSFSFVGILGVGLPLRLRSYEFRRDEKGCARAVLGTAGFTVIGRGGQTLVLIGEPHVGATRGTGSI